MKRHFTTLVLMILTFLLSSCATILNSRKTTLHVYTNQSTALIIDNDTLKNTTTTRTITVDRKEDELKLVVFNDSLTRTLNIKPFNSFAYWANLSFYYGLGMLVDRKNPKRYGYPKMIYVNLEDNTNEYLPFIPINSVHDKYWNVLKFTPLKLLGITNPAFELSYERRTAQSFSTQVMASYLLPDQLSGEVGFYPNIKGFRLAVEERFYFKKSAPFGPYIALEVDYLKNRYNTHSHFNYVLRSHRDTVGIKKQNISFNFKIGHQFIIKQFSIELYAGLGLRYKNVKHIKNNNPDDEEMDSPQHPNVFYITNREGKYSGISIPLNVRIGWTF